MYRQRSSILFISNGYGEDMISKAIIERLKWNDLKIKAMPLVGKGKNLEPPPPEIIGPRKDFPSGGFCMGSLKYLILDIIHGLPVVVFSQIREMLRVREKTDLVVCVGDMYPVILSFLFIRRPIIFIATYKSVYTGGYLWVERVIMRRCCKMVITKDLATSRDLCEDGISAIFVGNPMMDCIPKANEPPLKEDGYTVGLLPGSREEGYSNLIDMLRKVEVISSLAKGERISFIVAIAPSLSIGRIVKELPSRWRIFGNDILNEASSLRVRIVGFGDLIRRSDLVLGLAGTANEQTAGFGIPLVTFPGHGPQTTYKRMMEQKRLLGEGVSFVKNSDELVGKEVMKILKDKGLSKRMGEEGMRRMGGGGGVERIASLIMGYLKKRDEEGIS